VRPAKIVAGQECENTNIFLQKVYQAATAGYDTSEAVAQILEAYGQAEGAAPAQPPPEEDKPKKSKDKAKGGDEDKSKDKAKAKKEKEE